jgi:hypothetical protein
MAASHVSGPFISEGGLQVGVTVTASLPAAADNQGLILMITDDGAGDNEVALVVSDGTDWVRITTTALT